MINLTEKSKVTESNKVLSELRLLDSNDDNLMGINSIHGSVKSLDNHKQICNLKDKIE